MVEKKLPTRTRRKREAMGLTDEDVQDPHRITQLRYDRGRFAEAIANGYTRREAMRYARNDSLAMATKMDAMILEPQVRQSITERLEEKQHMILDYIDDMALDGADLGKLSAALGVITDRLRLYQGKATSISEKRETLSDADKAKIERILTRIGPRKVHEGVIAAPNDSNATDGEPVRLSQSDADPGPSGVDVAVADGGQRTEEVRV